VRVEWPPVLPIVVVCVCVCACFVLCCLVLVLRWVELRCIALYGGVCRCVCVV